MDDESQFAVSPEFWPELVATPYCARAGCPNPASHAEITNHGALLIARVLVYCRWHVAPQQAHERVRSVLPIDEYREWRAGARVRVALRQRDDLDTFEVETLISLVAGKLQWGAAQSVALEGLKSRRLVSGPPYVVTSAGRRYVEMALTQPGVISPSLRTGLDHVCGMHCSGQDGCCDMARRPRQTAAELARLPRRL